MSCEFCHKCFAFSVCGMPDQFWYGYEANKNSPRSFKDENHVFLDLYDGESSNLFEGVMERLMKQFSPCLGLVF